LLEIMLLRLLLLPLRLVVLITGIGVVVVSEAGLRNTAAAGRRIHWPAVH
jgi:hypothetical protein